MIAFLASGLLESIVVTILQVIRPDAVVRCADVANGIATVCNYLPL